MVDPSLIGPTTLAVTQGFNAFTTFLPKLTDIRKADLSDTSFVADVRMGEMAAVGLTVGVGVIVSSLTGSSTPAVVAVIVSLGLVFMYESALRVQPVGKEY